MSLAILPWGILEMGVSCRGVTSSQFGVDRNGVEVKAVVGVAVGVVGKEAPGISGGIFLFQIGNFFPGIVSLISVLRASIFACWILDFFSSSLNFFSMRLQVNRVKFEMILVPSTVSTFYNDRAITVRRSDSKISQFGTLKHVSLF